MVGCGVFGGWHRPIGDCLRIMVVVAADASPAAGRSSWRLPSGRTMKIGLPFFRAYRTVAQVPERRRSPACSRGAATSASVASTPANEPQVRLHEPFLISAWHSIKKLLAFGEAKPDPKLAAAELAAYTTTANVLLNLDEVVTRE